MAEFRLETERLVLRDWRARRLAEFFRLTNTPAVMRWLGGLLTTRSRQATCAQRDRSLRGASTATASGLVERKPDGGHLRARCSASAGSSAPMRRAARSTGEFEIGWRMREDAWGQGYAREAAPASLRAGVRTVRRRRNRSRSR